jgi:hypothetical protein
VNRGRPARAVVVSFLALASASAGASAGAPRSPVGLTAAPARLMLTGSGRATVRLTNAGRKAVVVDASRAGFALSLRGRPRIVRARRPRSAVPWLKLRPAHFTLPARTSATLLVSATVPRAAEPGDHDALVLLTTRPWAGARVAVRVRLGVLVVVRAPGAVVRRLQLQGLRAIRRGRRRLLGLGVVNRGTVTETLARVRVTIASTGRRRSSETVVARTQDVRPHTRARLEFRLRGRLRGAATARVIIPGAAGRGVIRRTYHLRL